jgi:hypothetical protein
MLDLNQMKTNKLLLPVGVVILFSFACALINFPQAEPNFTVLPTETLTETPSPTQIPLPTPTPTYIEATPVPEWVTDFGDPILELVITQAPDFQDDFSVYRQWFIRLSGVAGYTYAERYDEMLLLRLPEKTQNSIIFNPQINRINFVLNLDLRFNHDQPNDTIRFQFDGFPNQVVSFDLSNNRNWIFQWGTQDNLQSLFGIYPHFPPEHVPVTIIMFESQCAVYLNNDPLLYVDDCRNQPAFGLDTWITSFRLIRDTKNAVVINLDNLKLWDLDKISDLP